jgi:LemA protein
VEKMKKGLLVLGVVVGLVVILAMTVIGSRNGLVTADENISTAWSQVENVMQRRADLIPNLVETVKGYAKQEKEIFTGIADARARLAGASSIPEKIEANRQLDSALSRLLVIVERYPDLKSNQNFQSLQDELAGTENRIAVERKRFNDAVRDYNLRVRRFPSSIAAMLFGFEKKDIYFEAAEGAKAVPAVTF